jgi:anti-sigma factor RsiW
MSAHDRWTDRLSEYLDGELAAAERDALEAHLAECARCAAVLADLRGLVSAARTLPDRAPEHDLWPELARRIESGPSRARRWPILAAFAAGLLAGLAAFLALGREAPPTSTRIARGEPYLLLLHEPAGFGAEMTADEHAAVVARYAGWAQELGARCVGGDELAPEGTVLAPGAEPSALADGPRVGGYFLVEVADQAEALALARTCPHLEQGGWIELRRIRQH